MRDLMEMIKIFLDANIYDKLCDDLDARTRVANGVASGRIQIVATPVLAGEMIDSPFGGFPNYFAVSIVPETVAVLGHARVGMARLGTGEVYTAHRGASGKIQDAIMADSAEKVADMFVSEDARCRNRLANISDRCQARTYQQFREWLFSQPW
jgi:hypothetical protein